MPENPFEDSIRQLKEGTISEIVIEQKDFSLFREVWKNDENREKIVGEAGLNGKIIYRFTD